MKSIRKPPYESSKVSYKPSGIEWLGEIPQSWEIVKIKQVSKVVTGKTPCLENEWGNEMPFITPTDCFLDTKYTSLSQRKLSKIGIKNYNSIIIPQDSILVTCIASIGKVVMSNKEVITNQQINSVIPNTDLISPNFAFYVLLVTMPFAENYFCGYSILPILNKSEFSNIKIPLPPLQDQKAIAEFLDKKCDKISQFIESKQKLITLLQEKKQALINECVTKGLNCYTKHNVESRPLRGAQKEKDSRQYKNSGVEYLGTIPKHWEVRRLASFGKFSKGGNIWRNDLLDEGISTLIYGDIYTKYEIKTHTLHSKVSQETAKNATPIYKGDILFSGSGETKEDIGKNIVYLGDEKAFAGGDVIIFRQNQNDALFLSYALNTQGVRFCKLIESKGEIIVHIYASNLRDIKIPLPPLQEQKAIASYLDTQITKIDLAIEKTKQQITYIKEYKTSLINQAVCGRIQQNKRGENATR